jgi:AraC family transcriptional regulator
VSKYPSADRPDKTMALEIVERPAATVIGLSILTQPMSPEIPALWPKFVARIPDIPGQTEPRVTYGVMQSDAAMQALHYMACVAVRAGEAAPPGMEVRELPAGRYAVFRYPLARLGEGFGEVFGRLRSSDYEQAAGPLFERYGEAFDPADPQSMVEIQVPVRRRGG